MKNECRNRKCVWCGLDSACLLPVGELPIKHNKIIENWDCPRRRVSRDSPFQEFNPSLRENNEVNR